jgi:diguanylate cyclase (GGDEF)-like protein
MASRSDDQRLTRLLLEARGEAAVLREQLLRSDSNHRRLVRLLEIGWGVDLRQIGAATLDAAGALLEADAAMLVVRREDGEPVVASTGLPAVDERRLRALLTEGRQVARTLQLPRLDDSGADGGLGFPAGYAAPVPRWGPGGALAVLWREARPVGAHLQEVLAELALTAGVAVANERLFAEVREAAARDPLTGLYNRKIFHEQLTRAVSSAGRYQGRLAVCVLDVDDFKQVNTVLGHLDGDAILAQVADCLTRSVRSADLPCRIGGDEFAVVLPHSDVGDGARLYRRLADAVAHATRDRPLAIRISAGIAQLETDENAESFFRRAEAGMRAAKGSGKARLVVADSR